MGTTILNVDRDWKLLNADVTSAYSVDLKCVESLHKHVNKCEQRMNDIQPYQFEPEGTLQEKDDSKWLRF